MITKNKFTILLAAFVFAGNADSMSFVERQHRPFCKKPIRELLKTQDDQKLYDLIYRF